ncbi:hypothetical protein FLJC2902T_15230 [Flavobacterium limnosediminis JC2902]|uniref:Lipoprotein n=1 Tax=Flavobacterium limnosediminis JC2902 TaxID=1341181 RepID=V6SNB8_9FLAO|nr:hypothetical protein [Flavobacterium limnosediminis]ESU28178.1 hypothetical protein FLJC2902T_15230 [Flavobacterium limnosediminis JC2902]
MKAIKHFVIAVFGLLSLISCNSDDEFYNAAYVSVPDLITIDTPASYSVGDNVSFHTDFSRYLPEDGFTDPLDIYKTSKAESFGFAYRLEKETAPDVWTSVFDNGDEFSVAEAVYQTATQTYKCDIATPLNSAGNYRLGFGESYTGYQSTDLISRNPENETSVRITTNANNTNGQGYYYFTVN